MSDTVCYAGKVEDVADVFALESAQVDCPWSEAQLAEAVNEPRFSLLCAKKDGAFAGYILSEQILSEVHICSIAVQPDLRRRGVGQRLLSAFLEGLTARGSIERVLLEVNADNTAAAALYEKNGFQKLAVRPHYYGKDKTALIYALEC